MHDSGDSLDVSVCHTVVMTSLSICQLHDSSVCQQDVIPPGTLSVCQYVHHQFRLSNHQLNSWQKYP